MLVTLISSDFGLGYELIPVNQKIATKYERETGNESALFQSDWDFPRLAVMLGWNMARTRKCNHRGTDGTIPCLDCGKTAGYFIGAAQEWLDCRVDHTFRVPDCPYFDC